MGEFGAGGEENEEADAVRGAVLFGQVEAVTAAFDEFVGSAAVGREGENRFAVEFLRVGERLTHAFFPFCGFVHLEDFVGGDDVGATGGQLDLNAAVDVGGKGVTPEGLFGARGQVNLHAVPGHERQGKEGQEGAEGLDLDGGGHVGGGISNAANLGRRSRTEHLLVRHSVNQ